MKKNVNELEGKFTNQRLLSLVSSMKVFAIFDAIQIKLKMNVKRGVFALVKVIWKLAFLIVFFVLALLSFQYSRTCFYDFPRTKAFNGDSFYNPYASIHENSRKLKANFHAHGIAWGDYTYGANTDQEVYNEYKNKKYDLIGISNYHSLKPIENEIDSLYFPVYEHGCNALKSHCLVLNPKNVSFYDQPLWQTVSMQQDIIEAIRKEKGAIAMAHPELSGRNQEGMESIVHYDFIEVLNHYRVSDRFWDYQLSSGKVSWILSNDDTHDVFDETAFKIWNVVYSESKDTDSVLRNMKKGKLYGVKFLYGTCDKELKELTMNGNTMHIEFTDTINAIELIGQDGTLIYTHYRMAEFDYTFGPNDTYVRIEAHDNDFSIYLNPIFRYDGKTIPYGANLKLIVNQLKTWSFRSAMWLLMFLEFYAMYRILRKRKRA